MTHPSFTLAQKLCAALGIDPDQVTSLTPTLEAGQLPRITVTSAVPLIDDGKFDDVEEELRHFVLVERP